ncbi:hypothetical protein BXZ70DRAFT_1012980 [Cristinia sonorae]|uniref:Uncharacterized protein n=1 Tax=Cristinia sonorae TaxID=1940300 RepID=A0A8K0UDY3_9AGAR|nr:hypothetical protein BXZ70DRAFT_1012980 [Cristinia sonorae]
MSSSLQWIDRFNLQPHYTGRLTYYEAKAAIMTRDGKFVITSPNCNFVPEPIIGRIQVRMRSDGKFGLEDPVVQPQQFSTVFPFMSVIPTRPPNVEDPTRIMWSSLRKDDFECRVPGCGLGIAVPAVRDRLRDVMSALLSSISESRRQHDHVAARLSEYTSRATQAVERLSSVSTYRDTVRKVACVQRYFMYLTAYKTWYIDLPERECRLLIDETLPTNEGFMGAFSTEEPDVQRLLRLGIPVWFLRTPEYIDGRPLLVQPLTSFSSMEAVVDTEGVNSNLVYNGIAGQASHFIAIFNHSHVSSDIELVPFPEVIQPRATPTPSASHGAPSGSVTTKSTRSARAKPYFGPPKVRQGRDQFKDLDHEWMPKSIPAWAEALAHIDQSTPVYVSQGDTWRFWTPKPALLIGSSDLRRVTTYVSNWLRLRPLWYYVQDQRYSQSEAPALSSQQWREMVNLDEDAPKKAKSGIAMHKNKAVVLARLAQDCEVHDLPALLKSPIIWAGEVVGEIGATTVRQIIWDLFEVGFRIELRQLDLHLLSPGKLTTMAGDTFVHQADRELAFAAVFGGKNNLSAMSDPLPSTPTGLAAPHVDERRASLEAFREILACWPGASERIRNCRLKDADKATVESVEREMVSFYVISFYQHSGRPPILPHVFPTLAM